MNGNELQGRDCGTNESWISLSVVNDTIIIIIIIVSRNFITYLITENKTQQRSGGWRYPNEALEKDKAGC